MMSNDEKKRQQTNKQLNENDGENTSLSKMFIIIYLFWVWFLFYLLFTVLAIIWISNNRSNKIDLVFFSSIFNQN